MDLNVTHMNTDIEPNNKKTIFAHGYLRSLKNNSSNNNKTTNNNNPAIFDSKI